MRFNKETFWYPGYEAENRRFTGESDAVLDDQFDSTSIVCKGLAEYKLGQQPEYEDFQTDSELEFEHQSQGFRRSSSRNLVTGY